MDYWEECIRCAFEDAGIVATEEQIQIVIGTVEVSHENYGTAFGYDCIPNPVVEENKKLAKQLEIERSKRVCPDCKGSGRIIENYLNRSSDTQCSKCHGEGKII